MGENGILLKGGTVINPAGKSGQLDLVIKNGQILYLHDRIETEKKYSCRDMSGMLIFPAFIDLHVHLREPGQTHKEDIASGTMAALKGGFAAVAAMPNTNPVIDTPEWVMWLLEQGARKGIKIFPVPAISTGLRGQSLTNMQALVAAGAVAFTDDGMTLANTVLMRQALIFSRELNVPIIQHAEDPGLALNGQIDPGAKSLFKADLHPLPGSAEDCIVARDIALQNEVGGHLHITHLSTAFSADMITWARGRGQKVTADVTPHHLLLNFQSLSRSGTLSKMKPPLRSESDRLRLLEMLNTGMIDCVATDHAPHAKPEKEVPFEQAPFGVIGMETAFPLLYDRLVLQNLLPITRLVELFTSGPAAVINQSDRLGVLREGGPAHLVIFNPQKRFIVNAEYFRSKSQNSPFIGWEGLGVIEETILDGKTRYSDSP